MNFDSLTKADLTELLALEDFSPIYAQADQIRQETVGNQVYIRAILEFSNYCKRGCSYCGLNRCNHQASRYRMAPEEILLTAKAAYESGYQTLVLQSGEDPCFITDLLAELVKEITSWGMVVTVSCGEIRTAYATLKKAGASRYLLKHETADPLLYNQLHPEGSLADRIICFKQLKALGFETGSGFMVGLPGQTLETLAEDLLLLKKLNCDMAGIGPFIPHPATPLKRAAPGSPELTKRCVALARILLPHCYLPATTALGVMDGREKENVFSCGANVVMRKVTPEPYKSLYEIYPAHLEPTNIPKDRALLEEQILALGRIPV